MKRRKMNALLVLLFGLLFTGCNKYLDIDPISNWKDESFYSTKDEVQLALAGIYSQLATENLYGYRLNVTVEGGTDETYTSDSNIDIAFYGYNPANNIIESVWLQFYKCIHLVNQFEKNLKSDMFTEVEYNKQLAKARFIRGFCYFNLANWFGPVPLRLTPSQSQQDNDFAASPAFDVYQQVEKDYLFATEHLSHANSADYIPGEPNKMAAHGLLARLYLKMGGFQPYLSSNEADCYFDNPSQYFEKAKQQCEIIIQDGWHGIVPYSTDSQSYRRHFLTYLQDKFDMKESLFEISFGNLYSMGINVSGRLGNINGVEFVGGNDIPRGFANFNAGIPVYNIYSAEDTRREWSIAGYKNNYSSSTGSFSMSYIFDSPLNQEYGIGKFRRWEPTDLPALKAAGKITDAPYTILNNTPGSETDPNFTSINFPILRYSDILLMHAEAIIGGRFGSADADAVALSSLNVVRERAGLEPYEGSLVHDDFFKIIVDERMRELCFEGLRKQDLIRWDLLKEKLDETNRMIMESPDYRASSSYHTTFLQAGLRFDKTKHLLLPYPEQEVLLNSKLEQRTGW